MSELGNKEIMSKNIKKYMDKLGIDRMQLSKGIDVKYTTLCDWINAKTYPRIDKIEIMANYFGCSKSDLVESDSNYYGLSDGYGRQPYRCATEQYRATSAWLHRDGDHATDEECQTRQHDNHLDCPLLFHLLSSF